MKSKFLLCFVVAGLMAFDCFANAATLHDTKGHTIHLKNYRGKWLLVNYWATWCGPCLNEMPELDRLYKKYPKRVVVLGVNYDALPAKRINAFGKELGVTFPLLRHFPRYRYSVGPIKILPYTLVIGPNGKLRSVLPGVQTYDGLKRSVHIS